MSVLLKVSIHIRMGSRFGLGSGLGMGSEASAPTALSSPSQSVASGTATATPPPALAPCIALPSCFSPSPSTPLVTATVAGSVPGAVERKDRKQHDQFRFVSGVGRGREDSGSVEWGLG